MIARGRSYYHQVLFRMDCGVGKSLACRPRLRRNWRVRLRLPVGIAVGIAVEERKIVEMGRLVEEIWDDTVAVAVAVAGSRPYLLGRGESATLLSEVVPDFLFLGSKPDRMDWRLAVGDWKTNRQSGCATKKVVMISTKEEACFILRRLLKPWWLFKRTTGMSRCESVCLGEGFEKDLFRIREGVWSR